MRSHGWYARDLELGRAGKRRRRSALPTCCVRDCESRSINRGLEEIKGKLFCRRHAPAYRTHYAIVERIRSL